jgi:hypothetical protein
MRDVRKATNHWTFLLAVMAFGCASESASEPSLVSAQHALSSDAGAADVGSIEALDLAPTVELTVTGGVFGGARITFAATAEDPEDGPLPDGAFTWRVVILHEGAEQTFLGPLAGQRSGEFSISPDDYDASDAVWRVQVEVRDAAGHTVSAYRDLPVVEISPSLVTVPSGLQIEVNGVPYTTPANAPTIMFFAYDVAVETTQTLAGHTYEFVGWFGTDPSPTLRYVTPANSAILVAVFREAGHPAANLAALGTPIARVTAPHGEGNRDLEVIRDGVRPPVGTRDPALQYDTFGGRYATRDWIGYQFPAPQLFERVVFQEGRHYWYGGWFDTLTVQIQESDGTWQDASLLEVTPIYARGGPGYETFELRFAKREGVGIRLFGRPGGLSNFISVAELEVYGTL